MLVSLIGYRATGKTTIGSLLAERLGWSCIDTDEEVQRWAGKTVRDIFAEEGEPRFRDYEAAVIGQLARRHKLVLALGGGAVLREENRQAIRVAGPVVWLQASPETIRQRLAADARTSTQRPSLTGLAPADEVERVLSERLPLYAACADCRIDTESRTPREIVDDILRNLDLPSAL